MTSAVMNTQSRLNMKGDTGMKAVRSRKRAITLAMVCATVVCCVAFRGFAYAEDALPPSWRGLPNTTFQEWTFDVPGDYFMGVPDAYNNQYGSPAASSDNGWAVVGGKLLLDPGICMYLAIPNRPSSGIGDYTLVSFQMTYLQHDSAIGYERIGRPTVYALYEEPSQGKPIDDLPGVLVDEHDVLLNTDGGFSWRLWQSVWQVQPSQTLTFRICRPLAGVDYSSSRLDDLIVDTQYVPEPSAFAALVCGLVGIGVVRRRR